jgi:hypothetical protein
MLKHNQHLKRSVLRGEKVVVSERILLKGSLEQPVDQNFSQLDMKKAPFKPFHMGPGVHYIPFELPIPKTSLPSTHKVII